MARVLNEQQNPLSVGLSLNKSEHSYSIPCQKHPRNIPTASSVTPLHVGITYNIANLGENLPTNVRNKSFYLSENFRQLILIIIQNALGTLS